jgi:tetratricopeptide (TPR) repeat protein
MKKYSWFLLFLPLLQFSCNEAGMITRRSDYERFLVEGSIREKVENTRNEISFWNHRLQRDTGNFIDQSWLAAVHYRLFRFTGDPLYLRLGDSLLKRGAVTLNFSDPDILFALSQQSITRHLFRQAANYNEMARLAGGDLFTVNLLAFDAAMELGDYKTARTRLGTLADQSSFDYLVRKAKWEDHQGNLDDAILLMQQAFEKVKNRNAELYCWALSNLGDLFGHAGRINDAYHSYLKVLQKDNTYFHALKGIAWIAYSHDGNVAEAKRILQFILTQVKMPELWLELAEIAKREGNETVQASYISNFLRQMQGNAYGEMYNKYLVQVYTEELADHHTAFELARKEVENRPTPETYDMLAWVFYNAGQKEKAFIIARNNVWKRTFEPVAAYHTAIIFADNGMKKEAKALLEECRESSFELGPIVTKDVLERLSML